MIRVYIPGFKKAPAVKNEKAIRGNRMCEVKVAEIRAGDDRMPCFRNTFEADKGFYGYKCKDRSEYFNRKIIHLC